MQRYGSIIGIRKAKIEEYKKLHEAVWDDVLKKIVECNIHNYSIYLQKISGRYYLFSYFEYTGTDFAQDMQKMSEDARTQQWWALCSPCQIQVPQCPKNEWWMQMEEVFHSD